VYALFLFSEEVCFEVTVAALEIEDRALGKVNGIVFTLPVHAVRTRL
jgi:hypothetical protein